MNEKTLQVAALCNGTVIDRLPADKLFKAVSLLGLENYDGQITIGNNLDSRLLGKKGIIKIADRVLSEEESGKLALIAPHARVNIIRDYNVVEKRDLSLPKLIRGIVRCTNPKCISNNEPMESKFHVVDEAGTTLRCHYCEREISRAEAQLKGN